MFESLIKFFKGLGKSNKDTNGNGSKEAAKERLHLVLMQDRANVSADFLDLMKQEIIEVIKKYIDVDENEIDVRLANKTNEDGTTGAPALYANIPIVSIKEDVKKEIKKDENNKETVQKTEEIEEKQEIKPKEEDKQDVNISETKKQEDTKLDNEHDEKVDDKKEQINNNS